jgi:TetR/AcrR family transcriptional regulator, mexJK operon transcriptional repressor
MKKPIRRSGGPKRHTPGRPCANQAAERIEHLLDIAAEVFTERGYEGTSVGAIAERAGASKQTLYVRYPSKAEIFKAVMQRRSEAAHMNFSDILSLDKPVAEVLEVFGLEILHKILEDPGRRLLRTLISAVDSFPELATAFWESGVKRGKRILSDYIREQVRLGRLHIHDPEIAAQLFMSFCVGRYLLLGQLNINPFPSERAKNSYIKEAVRVFLTAYGENKTVHSTMRKRNPREKIPAK